MLETTFAALFDRFLNDVIPNAYRIAVFLAPLMLATILFVFLWELWLNYIRSKFYMSLKYAVLEIKLPREQHKNPLAMEIFLTALHNTSDGSLYARYWKGEYRPYYSLEIISIEGQVKFMIWCEDRRKTNLISALYS